jgi:hypothetical protein
MAEEKTAEEIATEKATAEKAEVKAARESIKVTTSKATEADEEKNEDEQNEEAEGTEAAVEENETKIEESETKVEDLEAQKAEAKTAKERDKFQKRIDREVGKRKALEDEIKELKAKLAAEPDKANALTEEEVNKRAKQIAQQELTIKEFNDASDRLFNSAVKVDKDFQKKINLLADDIGAIPGHLVGILDDLDNGGDVLVHFTLNPDDAEEIYQLSPARAAVRLAKLAAKIEADKKPAPKAISKVPDPTEPIKGGSKSPDQLPKEPTKNMAEFIRIRNKQAEDRRRAKLGMH